MAGKQKTDLRAEILRLIRDPKYRPRDKIEIANALGYGAAQRNEVRRTLRDLEKEGEIARIRKNRYVQPDTADLVTGTLSVHEAGYSFLTNEKQGQADLFIAAENTGTAMHGDRVVARIIRGAEFSRARTARPEGRVIRILTRANETIVGTLQQTRNFFYVVPDDPRLVHNIYVQPSRVNHHQPRRGDKVVVRLEAWESRHVNPEGKIIECLGPRTAPGVDILSIIRKYHLPLEFPKAILEEASRVAPGIPWFKAATKGQPLITGRVHGITTEDHPTQARRPAYSVLSNLRLKQAFALELPDWSCQLRAVFTEGRVTES